MFHLNMHIIILFAFSSGERLKKTGKNFKRKTYAHCGPNYFRILLFLQTFLMGFHFSQPLHACSVCKAQFLMLPSLQSLNHISELSLAQFVPFLVSALQRNFCASQLGDTARKGLKHNRNQKILPQPSCTFHCKSIHSADHCAGPWH